jgi:hypothetical protein
MAERMLEPDERRPSRERPTRKGVETEVGRAWRAVAAGIFAWLGIGDSALAEPLLGDASVYYSFDSFVDEVPETSGGTPPIDGDVYGNISMDGNGVRGSSAFFDPTPQFLVEHFIAIGGCDGIENQDACEDIPPERVPSIGYSLAAWVKLQDTGADQSIHQVRSLDGSFAVLAQAQGDGRLRFHLRGQMNSEGIASTVVFTDGEEANGTPWPVDTWFHYAATYDQPNDVWALYYNGQAIAGGATNLIPGPVPIGDWGFGSTIGTTSEISRSRQLFGHVDEYYIFTRAIRPEEVERLYLLAPPIHDSFNIDFGSWFGLPTNSYGAAALQPGHWNEAGLGVTSLTDALGFSTSVTMDVSSSLDNGHALDPAIVPDEVLLFDNFYSSFGLTWQASISGLSPMEYDVYLYAPSHPLVPTGDMTVNGAAVASIEGDPGGSLIEGTSYVVVSTVASDGTISISGNSAAFSGLAGLQLVPVPEPSLEGLLLVGALGLTGLAAMRRQT